MSSRINTQDIIRSELFLKLFVREGVNVTMLEGGVGR